MKIYDYDEKDRIVKIDDRTVYLTDKENKIFEKVYKDKYITIAEANEILADGYGTVTAVKSFITKLSNKLGMNIDLRK